MSGRKLAVIMWAISAVAASVSVAGAEEQIIGGSLLATRPPYPLNRADDVHRPGFNGREWIGRPVIGGVDTGYPIGWRDPGPAGYGADEHDSPRVWIKVGTETISINPWEEISTGGLSRLENARNEWLAQHGYVGGVRTFVNDSLRYGGMSTASADIQPRASFEWPIDQPRFKHRQQVHNEQGAAPAVVLRAGDRVSWPMSAPADIVARAAVKTAQSTIVRAN
ncbi:MAG: hypothetical protein IT436_17010 [Phycisphaerales bacterium]|nr:hypothetical protein [Phycisphaerales bacterium]